MADSTVRETSQGQLLIFRKDERNLEEAFWRFHKDNPQVYEILVRLAREWAARAGGKCGISLLFERARWELAFATYGEPVKLNNNYRAFFARLIMQQEPDLDGLFNLRKQRVMTDA